MHKDPHSIHLLLTGYSEPDLHTLLEGLTSLNFLVYTDDAICSSEDNIIIDCILTGDLTSDLFGEDIYRHYLTLAENYPGCAIIRGITTPDNQKNTNLLTNCFDGSYIIDFTSSFWKENLSYLILRVIQDHEKRKSDEGNHGEIFQRIFEENSIPMALSDPSTGVFIRVNQSFLDTLGFSMDEVIGKSSIDLQVFKNPDERNKILSETDRNTPARRKELIIRRKDGQYISGLFSVDLFEIGKKEIILTTMVDITYQKEVESSLSSKNQCLQEILSSINEGIVVYDTNLTYRVWNRFMEEITGVSEKEVLGKPALFFVSPENKGELLNLASLALQGIVSTSEDFRYTIDLNKKTGWVSIIYAPFRNTEGKIIGVIATVRDMNERKKAEDEIKAHKGLLRSIIDTVPVSIICFDEKGKILLVNNNFGVLFGVTPEIIEGHSYEEFTDEERFEQQMPLIKKALTGREVPFNEVLDGDRGSPKRYLRGRYSPLRGTDGAISGVVAVIIDITDLKIAQNSIEQINSKLNLLSSITRHDILNSLTGVLGYLAYAENEEDPKLLQKYIHKAYQTSLQIQEQIEFTRDYQDLGVKEPIWQNAKKIFLSTISVLKTKDITVTENLDGLFVYADPLLGRVIYNLIDNALRYGEKITRISSYWYEDGANAIWVVEDDGTGIAEDMKERIFRKGVGKHTGLGLFLAREILEITCLVITETGKEGEGAVFKIVIPPWAWEKRKS